MNRKESHCLTTNDGVSTLFYFRIVTDASVLEVYVFRFSIKSARVACSAIAAFAAAGCSASRLPLPGVGSQPAAGIRTAQAGRFTPLSAQPPVRMQMSWLMTDGSVLTQSAKQPQDFYRYVSDKKGDYSKGTWSQVGSLPAGYAPSGFASDVLADGRLLIIGGEHNAGGKHKLQLVNLGAIYDPAKMKWTPLGHPPGWRWIGDSPSSVLNDGRVLLGDMLHVWDAHFVPSTMQWARVSSAGKADINAGEVWTILPNSSILTADVQDAPNSEIYNSQTGEWTSAGSTIVNLRSPSPNKHCLRYGPRPKDCYSSPGETGPAILRPDGTVVFAGAGSGPNGTGAGHTAIYSVFGSKAGTWAAGPDFPNNDNAGGSSAVLEPSGKVLIFGRSGTLYEWNGSTLAPIQGASAVGPPILLPTGQIMMTTASSVVLYSPTGSPQTGWAPTIAGYTQDIYAGITYKLTGTLLNGVSQAMSSGAEKQNATNYPLVRITNKRSGNVYYARTHDQARMGVDSGPLQLWTYFDVPRNIAAGKATLEIVTNGIASTPVNVTVGSAPRSR